MPKAFLMKKKISIMANHHHHPHHNHHNHSHSDKPIFSPTSSGIGSPNNSLSSSISLAGSSSNSSVASLSPRNDENENRFGDNLGQHHLPLPLSLYDKNQNQGLDLSIKNLLKESNNNTNNNNSNMIKTVHTGKSNNAMNGHQGSKFVSSYPYPAKFAKIADFIRVSNESTKSESAKTGSTITKPKSLESLPLTVDHKPINYSRTSPKSETTSNGNEQRQHPNHHHQRMSPYSINWSEHFSINQIVSTPLSSSSSISGRDSVHSADESSMMMDSDHQNSSNTSTQSTRSTSEKLSLLNKKKSDRYQCEECNKSYSTQSGLAKHQEFLCANKQVKKSFSCKHCEKVYISLGALKMHIRTHTLPCKCKLCGKAFSRPWLLQGHIRTHTGEKPFACQYCNRAFADRSNLRAHLQTHSVVKKYSCKTCSRTFSRMSLLLKHEDNGCNGGHHHHHHRQQHHGNVVTMGVEDLVSNQNPSMTALVH